MSAKHPLGQEETEQERAPKQPRLINPSASSNPASVAMIQFHPEFVVFRRQFQDYVSATGIGNQTQDICLAEINQYSHLNEHQLLQIDWKQRHVRGFVQKIKLELADLALNEVRLKLGEFLSRHVVDKVIDHCGHQSFSSKELVVQALSNADIDEPTVASVLSCFGFASVNEIAKPDEFLRFIKQHRDYFEIPKSEGNDIEIVDKNPALLVDMPEIGGHSKHNYMYYRSCFSKITRVLFQRGELLRVCVLGDEGVGKSVYSLFVFACLVVKAQSVVKYSSCGSALYYDAKTDKLSFFLDSNMISREICLRKDVWVLLDEAITNFGFVDKFARYILFSQPKKSDYGEFISDECSIVYLPAWELQELNHLFESMPAAELETFCLRWDELDDFIGRGSNSLKFAKDVLKFRHELVGGRIGLIMNRAVSYDDLESMLLSDMRSSRYDALHKWHPRQSATPLSILYTLKPNASILIIKLFKGQNSYEHV